MSKDNKDNNYEDEKIFYQPNQDEFDDVEDKNLEDTTRKIYDEAMRQETEEFYRSSLRTDSEKNISREKKYSDEEKEREREKRYYEEREKRYYEEKYDDRNRKYSDDRDDRYEDRERYSPPKKNIDEDNSGKKKKSSVQYLVFIILTVFIGVVISLLAFIYVFSKVSDNKPISKDSNSHTSIESSGSTTKSEDTENGDDVLVGTESSFVGIITEIDSSKNIIEVYDFTNGKTYSLKENKDSEIKDKYNDDMIFRELQIGDILNTIYIEENNNFTKLKIDSKHWEKEEISNVKIDTNAKILTYNNDKYSYDNKIISLYKGDAYKIEDIKPTDTLTIKGYNKQLLYLEISKGHGGISVINKNKVKDGTVDIGPNISTDLKSAKNTYELSEGIYKVIVKGSNIDTYIEEIVVEEGKTSIVDLNNIPLKSGALTINSNVSGYKIYIDKKEYPANEPIMLEFGKYNVRVEKEGYETLENSITVDSDHEIFDATLKKIEPTPTPTPEKITKEVTITSVPGDAKVSVDGILIGNTPVTIELEPGYHTLLIEKEGYYNTDSPITIVENEDNNFSIELMIKPN